MNGDSMRRACVWGFLSYATALLLLVGTPTNASDTCYYETKQLSIYQFGTPSGGESIRLVFCECDMEPVGNCGEPIALSALEVVCTVEVACLQSDASSMAESLVEAINAADCPNIAAVDDGSGLFTVTYPEGLCMCFGMSAGDVVYPFSLVCGGVQLCDDVWYFDYSWGCVSLPQEDCVEEGAFGPGAVTINFDGLQDGLVLSTEYPGLMFEYAEIDASQYAVSAPNRIISVPPAFPGAPRKAIRVLFDPPAQRVGCNIDNDGFTGERQPQLRVCGQSGLSAACDYDQGPDFAAIELPDCEKIVSLELGGISFVTCSFSPMDGFDNLRYEPVICGDMDGDGVYGDPDLDLFLQALYGPEVDMCLYNRADINADGLVNGDDITALVDCLFGGV